MPDASSARTYVSTECTSRRQQHRALISGDTTSACSCHGHLYQIPSVSVVILNSDHMPCLEVAVSVFCQGTQVIETSCASCFLVVQIMFTDMWVFETPDKRMCVKSVASIQEGRWERARQWTRREGLVATRYAQWRRRMCSRARARPFLLRASVGESNYRSRYPKNHFALSSVSLKDASSSWSSPTGCSLFGSLTTASGRFLSTSVTLLSPTVPRALVRCGCRRCFQESRGCGGLVNAFALVKRLRSPTISSTALPVDSSHRVAS